MFSPTSVDILVDESGYSAEVVSSMLLILELYGYISAAPGGGYLRTK
jgi:DNA processing protein